MSLSHPHLLPLLLPFSPVLLPEGQMFFPEQSPSPHVLPCPGPLPWLSIPKPPAVALPPRLLPCSLPPAMLLHLLQGTTAQTRSRGEDGGHHQLQRFVSWSWGGGQGAPITHARTCSKANLYLPLRLSRWRNVRTHGKAANRTAGGSPRGQAEQAGARARRKSGAAGSRERASGLCPMLVSPHLLQLKSSGKNGAKPLALAALPSQRAALLLLQQAGRVRSLAGGGLPTKLPGNTHGGKEEGGQWW